MNYYYHLTQPEFVSTIQKEGLKPMLGKRSKSIGDKEERLCLCSESSIDAWSIMLGTNTVIKVVVPDEDKMELIDQGNVSDEYNYDGVIPPEYIVDIFTVNPSTDSKEFPIMNSGCGISKNPTPYDVIFKLKEDTKIKKVIAIVDTDLSGADFYHADLRGVDLSYANLYGADLRFANLRDTKINHPIACPETGSFIGYKKAFYKKIVKLQICEDAKRSSATTKKCRCSKALVLAIENIDGSDSGLQKIESYFDFSFIYRVGKIIEVSDFDNNRWNECAPGIHFFMDRQDAVDYEI